MWSFKKNISVKSWYTLPIELSNDLYSKKIENEREYYRDIFQRYQQTLIEISEISEIVITVKGLIGNGKILYQFQQITRTEFIIL